MTHRTRNITRNNLLQNTFRVRRELRAETLDLEECRRLLDESLQVVEMLAQACKGASKLALEASEVAGKAVLVDWRSPPPWS